MRQVGCHSIVQKLTPMTNSIRQAASTGYMLTTISANVLTLALSVSTSLVLHFARKYL